MFNTYDVFPDSQLAAFLTEGKRGVQPAGLPTQPDSPLDGGEPSQKLCPVPGCSKRVKRLWNHLNEYHKKRGDAVPHHPQRRQWSKEEEKILKEEIDVMAHQTVPTRRKCLEIMEKHPDIFNNRNKVETQDKCRRMIRKTSHHITPPNTSH